MDDDEIKEFQASLIREDAQLHRGKVRLTFLAGFLFGLVLQITNGAGLPWFTWITIPVGMGFMALFLKWAFLR